MSTDGAAIARRILAAFPAGTYELEALLRVLAVRLTDEVDTAAITCSAGPELLLNPAFLAEHCASDERLFMLVMHELYHLLQGHTRLFPRVTPVQNIAFDAVINAILCRRFPHPEYLALFRGTYDPARFPECLLLPPAGWPDKPRVPDGLPPGVPELIRALYMENGATYYEIFERLRERLATAVVRIVGRPEGAGGGGGEPIDVFLLGDHQPDGTPDREESARGDPVLGQVLRKIIERWPRATVLHGRDLGGDPAEALVPQAARQPQAVRLLARALKLLVLRKQGEVRSRQRRILHAPSPIESPLPALRDRRAVLLRAAGEEPVLYRETLDQARPVRERGLAYVYVDVSGSTEGFHGHMAQAVRPLVERGLVRLWQFSTQVHELTPENLKRGRLRTTYGTEIACVCAHMQEHQVARALVLTDGQTGQPDAAARTWLARRRGRVVVALIPDGTRHDLEGWASELLQLPLNGGDE